MPEVWPMPCENCKTPATLVWENRQGRLVYCCNKCKPAAGIRCRPIEPGEAVIEDAPLTVAQMATKAAVSQETVRRRLPDLQKFKAAWRTNGKKGQWRIDPAGWRKLERERSKPKAAPKRRHARKTATEAPPGWPDPK